MSFFTNNRWLPVITLLLLTANIVTLGFLWTHKNTGGNAMQPPPPMQGGGQAFEFITATLHLDSAQQKTYRSLRDEHQAGAKPLQDSVRKAKDDFFELLKQQDAPDALVQAQSSKIAAAEQQLDIFTFRHFQKLRAICTAEQQKKFDEIIQDVLRRMAPRGKNPQGPPPGMHDGMPPPPGGEGTGDRRPPPPGEGDRMPPPPKNK